VDDRSAHRGPRSRRPAGFCATYLISLFFVLPVLVFASPYAAVGGMTAAHGLQYLVLVSLVAGGGSAGRPGARPGWSGWRCWPTSR